MHVVASKYGSSMVYMYVRRVSHPYLMQTNNYT